MTPTAFHLAFQLASALVRGLRSASRARRASLQFGLLVSLVGLGGCSDMTSPTRVLNRAAVDSLMPSVTDARLRIASGITDIPTREKVIVSLSSLEIALKSDNAQHAQDNITTVSDLLTGYRAQSPAGDGADISAVFLMLNAATVIVDAGNAGSP